jgi:hypothetical protein
MLLMLSPRPRQECRDRRERRAETFPIFHFKFIICHRQAVNAMPEGKQPTNGQIRNGKWKMKNPPTLFEQVWLFPLSVLSHKQATTLNLPSSLLHKISLGF